MPFSKYTGKISRSQLIENSTIKNGWHYTVYGVNGSRYVGEWKNNKKEGKGRMLTKSNILYEGEWQNNQPMGFGVLCYPNPNKKTFYLAYRGQFGFGLKNSIGKYHRHNGSYYAGDFKDGKRHGYGILWQSDGSFYAGDFLNGYCHGLGTYVRVDGNRYDGEWKEGLKHGNGRFFHLDKGQIQSGIWVNDICVSSEIEDIPYRQCSISPTKYPIKMIALNNWRYSFHEKEGKM